MDSIKQNQISTTTVGSSKRFKALDNMLHVVGLYPIAMGMRREPIPTRQNPSGYSEPTTSENRDGTFNYEPADDVTRWAHDEKCLYNVMLNTFHESTNYLCADSFTSRDGIAIYKRMHKHYYGHTEADMNRLRRLLQNFKGSTATCLQEVLVRDWSGSRWGRRMCFARGGCRCCWLNWSVIVLAFVAEKAGASEELAVGFRGSGQGSCYLDRLLR